jgi:hypothetical protein
MTYEAILDPAALRSPYFGYGTKRGIRGFPWKEKKNIDNYVNSDALVVQQKH